jgi:hypothetical protein
MTSRKEQKLQARAARLAREAKLKADQRRRRLLRRASALAAVIVGVGVAGIVLATGGGANPPSLAALPLRPLALIGRLRSPGPPGPLGAEGVPVPSAAGLASAGARAGSAPVDGIRCLGGEQVAFHIHAHLTLFVHGKPRQVPYGVGINNPAVSQTPAGAYVGGGSCFYWLHSHAADGIIHIESPIERVYTLGEFFDVWGQQLGPARVGPVAGRVTAIYDGQLYQGNPRNIPLTAHAQIQLEVGTPLVSPDAIAFPQGL